MGTETEIKKPILAADECTDGKVWNQCGTACPTTCDNLGEAVMCTLQCVAGCYCPSDKPILRGTECVTEEQCAGE